MNGAESLLRTAKAAGAEICFANPGTTEMSLVQAFDDMPGVRSVLGLSEGVVTGAADGYTRMTGTPAMTLLHLGPGLANGLANLHNARRARSPVVNVVGEHASWHQPHDPPLAGDIESLARPVSGWVGRTGSARSAAADFARAWQSAATRRLPATLIAAADHMWSHGGEPAPIAASPPLPLVDDQQVHAVAKVLAGEGRPALLLGGSALTPEGLRTAARIAHAAGGDVLTERSPARIDRDPTVPQLRSLPYFPEDQLRLLDEFTDLILIGAITPVSFFGYPELPGVPVPASMRVHTLATPDENALGGLEQLAESTHSEATHNATGAITEAERRRVQPPHGALDPSAVAAAIVSTQPEAAIVVNEGISSAAAYSKLACAAPAHTELALTGGAIGMGIPLATGAAIACPERPVIDLQADGSALYTLQGLWTQAREGLDVTTVVCANRRYRILEAELHRAGVRQPGTAATGMTGLDNPAPDWMSLAAGFGVACIRATTGEELVDALHRAHAEPGPHLIEALL
ncbi:acetolactate synthase-1/2/3 large subunit [Halopolyspora algeriensis]|uniref:Acetolactate synthase-1/2/3 large subunit n=1 Tax=Halopolyspora algeriensis TaxID=1500506 RepID=A0A368VRV2_9ACTN|nr:acetolactate synthase large subunit [Halopolyspora algeriensis]RCW44415.1 acetolactate synthase-1/2/3 large subunit [Halopolyspora algeriensis]TQM55776.1 acetolactate synthase-1/2/3 large subunit [Halopolyspora algeriensis]